jgi:hypothetical protein
MALRIKRQSDTRQVGCILHRVADIPGGVTIDISTLGGSTLLEGTPIGVGATGKYNVVKTAKMVTQAANNAVNYEVAKGHQFKVGQYIGTGSVAYTITAIDKTTNADKDVITLNTTLGVVCAVDLVLYEAAAESAAAAAAKNTAVAIVGSSYDITASENLVVEAFVIAVVKETNAVPVLAAIKTALKSIIYI